MLASSARMVAMGGTWLVGKPIEARKVGGPTRGFAHVRWLCAETAGHTFLAPRALLICSLGTCCTGEKLQ